MNLVKLIVVGCFCLAAVGCKSDDCTPTEYCIEDGEGFKFAEYCGDIPEDVVVVDMKNCEKDDAGVDDAS